MSIIVSDLHISLSDRPILRSVNMTAGTGQLTAIIGPNGSGKTTLMRALTAELSPIRGNILMNGADVAGQTAQELARQRAVLPQQSALGFPFTAAEVVRIGLDPWPIGPDLKAQLIRETLFRVGLPDHAGRFWQDLSGGEQQRVQLARALAQLWAPRTSSVPRWLMLDEPVSSLDIAHQLAVMQLAADHAAGNGGTIAVMHDLNLTAMFAHHVVLLKGGQVLAEGSPDQVLTDTLLEQAYGCRLRVRCSPSAGVWLLPQSAA